MAYIPFSDINAQFVDSDGNPLNGGVLYFYYAGTNDAAPIYSDSSGTNLGSSVTLNSLGYPESGGNAIVPIWRESTYSYKVVLKTAAGATVWTADNIPAIQYFSTTYSDKLDGIEELADVTDIDNVQPLIVGAQDLWLPAEVWYTPTTGGAAAIATTEATAGLTNYRGFAFDGATKEAIETMVALPTRWDEGNLTARIFWTSEATDTDGVTWEIKAGNHGDGENIAQAWGTPVTIDDTLAGAAGKVHVTAATSAFTPPGTVAANELTSLRVSRDVDNANDTATEDATVLGVKLIWTSDSVNDA